MFALRATLPVRCCVHAATAVLCDCLPPHSFAHSTLQRGALETSLIWRWTFSFWSTATSTFVRPALGAVLAGCCTCPHNLSCLCVCACCTLGTGVFIKGQVVMEPKTVARTYLKSWFLIDFLTRCAPLATQTNNSHANRRWTQWGAVVVLFMHSIPYTNVAVLFIEDDTSGDAELALRIPRLLRLLRMARLLKLLRVSSGVYAFHTEARTTDLTHPRGGPLQLFKLVRVMNKWSDSSGYVASFPPLPNHTR